LNLDNQARVAYKKSQASAVYYLFLASYGYYLKNESFLSDEVFDKMAKVILDKGIKHSLLSHLITDDDLRAGSLFRLKASDYPDFIFEEAERLIRGVKSYATLE